MRLKLQPISYFTVGTAALPCAVPRLFHELCQLPQGQARRSAWASPKQSPGFLYFQITVTGWMTCWSNVEQFLFKQRWRLRTVGCSLLSPNAERALACPAHEEALRERSDFVPHTVGLASTAWCPGTHTPGDSSPVLPLSHLTPVPAGGRPHSRSGTADL